MRTQDQKLNRLHSLDLFGSADRHQLESLARIADEVDVKAGTVITRQGETARDFFVIEQGSADVTRDGQKIGELNEGDFFGEVALIEAQPRMATVTATSDATLLVVQKQAFDSMQENAPGAHEQIVEAVKQRTGLAQDQG
jgi:CRP-like cAMP-binding protein